MKIRQKFLTESIYNTLSKEFEQTDEFWEHNSPMADSVEEETSIKAWLRLDSALNNLFLEYTAGKAIEFLLPNLEDVINKYELRQRSLAEKNGVAHISPLEIEGDLIQYEECVQVISLCVLLNQTNLAARFAKLIDDGGYKGEDALYESLLMRSLPGREYVDGWYHEAYRKLICVIDAQNPVEAAMLLNEYCTEWYSCFGRAQWHDSHLGEDDQGYVGYWAFEAAAVAYLYDIDDSKITHMVYPKDLVEYARNSSRADSLRNPRRVSANNPCPKTGYWFSSAQSESVRYFNQGEIMPEFKGSSWGSTIWYWSGENE